MDRIKVGTATLTAAIAVIGGGASVIAMMWFKVVDADAGLPIISALASGGGVFLWNKMNNTIDKPPPT